jgi:hypothetical protein
MSAFQSQIISTVTVEATVTCGELVMSIGIKRRDNDITVSSLTWTITAGSGWQLTDQYILLYSTLTVSGVRIRIYIDNAATDANSKFGGSFGENNGAGLIDTTTNTAVLSLAWLIKNDKGDPNSNWFCISYEV